VSKKTHADFDECRATLSAERGEVQTPKDVVMALLELAQKNSQNTCPISYLLMDGRRTGFYDSTVGIE
jgi:hypothetical protein